jgi:hypothetical protein
MTKRNKKTLTSKPAFIRCGCGRNYPAGDCKCGANAVEGKCRCGRNEEEGSIGCVSFPACCDEFMCDGEESDEDYEII